MSKTLETVSIIPIITDANIKNGEKISNDGIELSNDMKRNISNLEEMLNQKEKNDMKYDFSSMKDIIIQQKDLKDHLNELKKNNIENIYNENKVFIDYFHEKYDTNAYGDNTSDTEILNMKKEKFTYLKSLDSIEDYNKPLLNISKAYDNNKIEEKQKKDQKYNTLSYGLCEGIDNEIDPKEYLKKNVFNVLMPGIQELLT